jgi:hypothetical protein
MLRAFFLAVGITMCIVGAECLAVERFELAARELEEPPPSSGPATLFGSPPPGPMAQSRDLEPPEWAPWSLLSAGAVIILYSLTINRG